MISASTHANAFSLFRATTTLTGARSNPLRNGFSTGLLASKMSMRSFPRNAAAKHGQETSVVSRAFAAESWGSWFEDLPAQLGFEPNSTHSFSFIHPQFGDRFSVFWKRVNVRIVTIHYSVMP